MVLLLLVKYANEPWSRSPALNGEPGLLLDGATYDFALDLRAGNSGKSSPLSSPSLINHNFCGADFTLLRAGLSSKLKGIFPACGNRPGTVPMGWDEGAGTSATGTTIEV
jgi:hypothetical protein